MTDSAVTKYLQYMFNRTIATQEDLAILELSRQRDRVVEEAKRWRDSRSDFVLGLVQELDKLESLEKQP